jgi:hypothetical protein
MTFSTIFHTEPDGHVDKYTLARFSKEPAANGYTMVPPRCRSR